jgi:hypothetical protein
MGILTSRYWYVLALEDRDKDIYTFEDGAIRYTQNLRALEVSVYDFITVRRRGKQRKVDLIGYDRSQIFTMPLSGSLKLKYCITDNTGISSCGKLIKGVTDYEGNPISLKRVSLSPSVIPCKTPSYAQGAIIVEGTYDVNYLNPRNYMMQGALCEINITDVPASQAAEKSCCIMSNIKEVSSGTIIPSLVPDFRKYLDVINWSRDDFSKYECPYIFLNSYVTSHCDTYMSSYCSGKPSDGACQLWLVKSVSNMRNPAAEVYQNYCSTNLNDPVCMLFSEVANDYGMYGYSDNALTTYCTNNPSDSNCQCYFMARNPHAISASTFIGPLECWFKGCAEQANTQFLSSAQIRQRRGCRIAVCDITIGSINSPGAVVNLINSCGYSVENSVRQSQPLVRRSKMIPIMPIAILALLAGLALK